MYGLETREVRMMQPYEGHLIYLTVTKYPTVTAF